MTHERGRKGLKSVLIFRKRLNPADLFDLYRITGQIVEDLLIQLRGPFDNIDSDARLAITQTQTGADDPGSDINTFVCSFRTSASSFSAMEFSSWEE